MAFDSELADRVRELVGQEYGVSEKRMFGGLAFLVNGNMAVAANSRGQLMLRVPAEDTAEVAALEHAGPMTMSGREIRGWVQVDEAGCRSDEQLAEWVERGMELARALPPK